MKLYFQWKFEVLKKIKLFNSDHAIVLDTIDHYEDENDKLVTIIKHIGTADEIMATDHKGITDDVKEIKMAMAKSVIQYAHKGLPLARNAGNQEMIKLLKHELSYVYYASKTDALARARNIMTTLKDNDTIFTNILPADIIEMVTKIDAYDGSTENTKTAIEHKKITGTVEMEKEFEKSVPVVENMMDYVKGYLSVTHPELVEELEDLIALDKTGARHTGIIARFKDNNPPAGSPTNLLEGVLMKIVERNQTAISDINGIAMISEVLTGTFHVECTKEGFVPQTLIIEFKRGAIQEKEITMVRVTV